MNIKVSLPKFNQYTLPFKQMTNTPPANSLKKSEGDTFEMSIGSGCFFR